MKYLYKCKCGEEIEKDFPMGKAAFSVKCKCKKKAERSYSFTALISCPTHEAREGRGRG